ncbi:thioesterase family protein [Aliiroseovarius subalbicans]|uniref:acyl-CoA thioesterase n=1 Tax=Aliiroseovarius subalbicans TaxID=2925840 RepID=UPI001F59A288|nr:thioesterase family protein [Aliiroseovarius subalbicans]MCI2400745.1 acyl-CoA thioesterase [Aliiroseovarius subalbicans]
MAELETLRRIIGPEECDILGHMNVSRYFACVSDAGFGIMAAFGLGRGDVVGGKRQSFAVVHSDATFHSEVLAGEGIYMRSHVTEIGRRSASFHHRMYRVADDKLLFETLFKCVLMDLERRRATVINEDMQAAMRAFLLEP